jgi:tetratricopeptide (TPR) repeat protein
MEKNNKLSLSQIGLYNPQRLNDETIEQIFVVRTGIFNQLMDKLQKEKPKGIPQHYLIIGQRGMGKTTLLKRIEVELRKNKFSGQFIPLLLPEEQYNLKNLAEFWLNSLDALADTLEFEKHSIEVQQVDAKVKELQQIQDKSKLAKDAFLFLKSFCLTLNRRPVLLIDNMSLIFDRMGKEEQHTLRAWLMQNGAPILLGASATTIEDTFNYGAPFYDAFQIHHLKKLSFDELVEIISNLATLTQEETIRPELQSRIARLKTLHQLTGGNPRTATMLFRVVIKGFSKEINDDLEALLDEITPLYKARFEELPTQLQVIVDAIALNWDPILIEQLRKETRYENNQLSPQLKRLTEAGWIEKIITHEGKGFAYQISERFFNIWFLMRRSSRRQKRELYCLSKFLESFYGDEITTVAQNSLQSKSGNLDHITYSLALAEVVKDETIKRQLLEKTYRELFDLAKTNPEILKKFELSDTEIINKPIELFIEKYEKLFNQYKESIDVDDFITAKNKLLTLIELTKPLDFLNASMYAEMGNLLQLHLHDYLGAEKAYITAISLNEKDSNSWNNLGNLYQNQLNNFHEAEKAYKKAIDLDSKLAAPWNGLGNLYQNHLSTYIEAEKAYITAITLDVNYAQPWNGLGNLYQNHLYKFHEAEKAYQKAIDINKDYASPWFGIGSLYHYSLQDYIKAEMAYKIAITLKEDYSFAWNALGNLYLDNMHKYAEAENAYLTAIRLDEKSEFPKYNLIFLLRDKLNRVIESEEILNKLEMNKDLADSFWLNKTLFALYKHNKGIAYDYLLKALYSLEEQLPLTTQDDWWRFGAVANKLGYGKWLTEILEEKGFDIILSPYYVAIKAMDEKDTEGFLNSKAVEIREPARKIMEIMKSYTS